MLGSYAFGQPEFGAGPAILVTDPPVTVAVECAFDSNPGDATYGPWTAITASVRVLGYQWGRQNELGRMETGTSHETLKDETSAFDPDNAASPYAGKVIPMRPLRARVATRTGTIVGLLQHFVERWPRTMRVGSVYTELELTTVDAFDMLAAATLAGKSYAQEATGTRVANVLNDIGWPAALRSIDAGDSEAVATTFAAGDTTSALDHLLSVADSERGVFYINGDGLATFVGRHTLAVAPFSTPQATFSDSPTGDEIGYTGLVPSYDRDHIANEQRGTREGASTTLAASDATSQTKYGKRTATFDTLVPTDTELLLQVTDRLAASKDPQNRIESLTVMPGMSVPWWSKVLSLKVGDRITVKETPPGEALKTKDYFIQRVAGEIQPGPVQSAQFTFGLSPAPAVVHYWILGDATYSVLGSTTVPLY